MYSFPTNPFALIKLQDRLLREVDTTSILGYSIFEGAKSNPKEAIQMVKDQVLSGHFEGMERIVGKELLKEIINFSS